MIKTNVRARFFSLQIIARTLRASEEVPYIYIYSGQNLLGSLHN